MKVKGRGKRSKPHDEFITPSPGNRYKLEAWVGEWTARDGTVYRGKATIKYFYAGPEVWRNVRPPGRPGAPPAIDHQFAATIEEAIEMARAALDAALAANIVPG